MAYSQGFNPHPKVSWAGAAPTGVGSEAEYLEIQLVEEVDPAVLVTELDAALPPGIDVVDAVPASSGALADRIDASRWRIELPGVSARALRHAADALLAADRVEVQRLTKDGMRTIDVRPSVVRIDVQEGPDDAVGEVPGVEMSADGDPCGILVVVVRSASPVVRPDDVLSALRVVATLEASVPAKATRVAQGRLEDDGGLSDPLARDRVAASGKRAREPMPDQHDVD